MNNTFEHNKNILNSIKSFNLLDKVKYNAPRNNIYLGRREAEAGHVGGIFHYGNLRPERVPPGARNREPMLTPGCCLSTGIVAVAPAACCRPPPPWPLQTPPCRPGPRGQ